MVLCQLTNLDAVVWWNRLSWGAGEIRRPLVTNVCITDYSKFWNLVLALLVKHNLGYGIVFNDQGSSRILISKFKGFSRTIQGLKAKTRHDSLRSESGKRMYTTVTITRNQGHFIFFEGLIVTVWPFRNGWSSIVNVWCNEKKSVLKV